MTVCFIIPLFDSFMANDFTKEDPSACSHPIQKYWGIQSVPLPVVKATSLKLFLGSSNNCMD